MVDRVRRADILAAAEAEFAVVGYAGGRIERIAAAARVNKQLLFHYFGSKEGLLTASLETLFARLEPPAGSSSPADELRQLVRFLEHASRENPGLTALLADAHFNPVYPKDAQRLVRSWVSRLSERARTVVAEGQRRGYFRDDIDPPAVAQVAVSAAIWGVAAAGAERAHGIDGMILDFCAWR